MTMANNHTAQTPQARLLATWRANAAQASQWAVEHDERGDGANAHAFRKEWRIWTTCADELETSLRQSEAPPPASAIPACKRTDITDAELTELLHRQGHCGDAHAVDYLRRNGLGIRFTLDELKRLITAALTGASEAPPTQEDV